MPGKDKNQKEEENKGLFSKFRKSKKKSDQVRQSRGRLVYFGLLLVDLHFVCLGTGLLSCSDWVFAL